MLLFFFSPYLTVADEVFLICHGIQRKNKLNVYIERYDPNTTQGTTTMLQFCVFRVLIFFVLFNLGKILH